MNLVAITLDEDEQAFLLGIAGEGGKPFFPRTALSIAAKVRRAQDVRPWLDVQERLPEFPACGICGIPRDVHDRLPDATDHTWRWNVLPPFPEQDDLLTLEKLPSREEVEGPRDG